MLPHPLPVILEYKNLPGVSIRLQVPDPENGRCLRGVCGPYRLRADTSATT
jgi:hypothetical protein